MWGDFARLGTGTAIGQLLVIATMPLLTRLYDPASFGILGLFLSFIAVAMILVGLRFDLAIASADHDEQAGRILRLALVVIVPTSLLAAFALWLLINGDWFGFGLLPVLAPVGAAILLIFSGVFLAIRYWHVRRRGFHHLSVAAGLQGAGRAAAPLLVAFWLPGFWGLFAGEVAGRMLGLGRLIREARDELLMPRAGELLRTAREQWRYPAIVLPSSLVDALATALPAPFLVFAFGPVAAGQFALVQRVAAAPAGLIAGSFADVIHGHALGGARDGTAMRRLLWASAGRVGLLGALVYVPVVALAPTAFPLVFGRAWDDAGLMLAILSPYLWLALIVSPLSRILLVRQRAELKLAADLIGLAVPAVALWLTRDAPLLVSIGAFSFGSCIAYLFHFAMIWVAAGRAPAEVGAATAEA